MNDSRYYKRTILKKEIASEALGQRRGVRIYLPPGYSELLSYPVLYCQDGEDFFNFGRVATHATRLILDDGMQPVIIVGVDVDKSVRTAEYAPEGSRFAAYCKFFSEELVRDIERHFPARTDASDRVLAGDSLGGTVSLHLALDYPHLFNQVISLSGAFLPSTQQRIALESDLSRLNIYMVIGLEEREVSTDRGVFDFLGLNRETQKILSDKRANVLYKERQGKHIWGFWQNELPEALLYFFS